MKIQVAKKDIEAALQVATIGIASSGSDLSTHYLFRIKGGKVEVLTYNQRILTMVPLTCQHEGAEDEALTVEGWRILKWLAGVGDVAVTIETSGPGETKLKAPRSTIRTKSLDPTKFPYWDKTLAEAKQATEMDASRLASALEYAKSFIFDQDTSSWPEIGQTEVLNGCLWATDKKAVTLIALDGFGASNFRIHGKDVPAVLKFLSLKETEKVEVLEHERTAFFRRADGALIGAARPHPQFPKLAVARDGDDDAEWEISTDDLLAGIQCLSASAEKDNKVIRLSYDDKLDKVVLAVNSSAGGQDTYPLDCVSKKNPDKVADVGFDLDHSYLTHIVGHFGVKTLKLGINKKGKGGYVRFKNDADKDVYLTVVVWRV